MLFRKHLATEFDLEVSGYLRMAGYSWCSGLGVSSTALIDLLSEGGLLPAVSQFSFCYFK